MRLRTRDEAHKIEIDDAVLTVRPLPMRERDRLQRKCTTEVFKRGVRVSETDAPRFNLMLFDATVQGWEGVEDEDGRPLECTEETKRTLAELNPRWVQDVLDAADRVDQALTEDARGNSPPGPTPS